MRSVDWKALRRGPSRNIGQSVLTKNDCWDELPVLWSMAVIQLLPGGVPTATVNVALRKTPLLSATTGVCAVELRYSSTAPFGLKPEPDTATDPVGGTAGFESLIPIVTVNAAPLDPVPPGVVTDTVPLLAPIGTTAVSEFAATLENVAATPLKVTPVAPVKPDPLTITDVPI